MDVAFVVRQRLEQLGLEQRDVAAVAQVTESYSSQLLTAKKAPPAPGRTDIYGKVGQLLKLPNGELAKLAELQRKKELKRKLGDPPAPLFRSSRIDSPQMQSPQRKAGARDFREAALRRTRTPWSPKSSWTWSRESPKKNWKMRTGSP
jgi:transcriptional regulator with XRE-family HTH domain